MRLLLATILGFVIAGNIATLSCNEKEETREVVRDSIVYLPAPSTDSLFALYAVQKKTIDSLNTELFLSEFRVERVRYYLNICIKNPSQDKFLKGWIKRAIQ
jgi:hypothetical protein